jgi:hypothetical protein
MDWQDQLRDIVRYNRPVPGFAEWLRDTGYADIPQRVTGPLQMQSLARTLYARYLNERRKAA